MKNVLFIASEAVPFIKTGGLADVVGSLPKYFNKDEFDVRVMIPKYTCIPWEYREKMVYKTHFYIDLAWRTQYVGVFEMEYDGVIFYFIDNEFYFGGPKPYSWIHEDIEKFAFFSKAALSALPVLGFRPDIIHCNDWQTALVPVYYYLFYSHRPWYYNIKSLFTIHNIQYQGEYGWEVNTECVGIPASETKILEMNGKLNMMKGAIETATRVSTVSPSYAAEIKDPWFSWGLHDELNLRHYKLCGIKNGIDTESYNPETDYQLYRNYSKDDMSGKGECKRALQERLCLEQRWDVPLVGMVTRLVAHKGLDLVRMGLEELMDTENMQFVILGSGDKEYEDYFNYMQAKYPGRLCFCHGFVPELARKIYSGADIFLMPSAQEPCGLAQMIALRYGTIPVVREVGGLKDSVFDSADNYGNGFTFKNYECADMQLAVRRALWGIQDDQGWHQLMWRAMMSDNSWDRSAQDYINLYNDTLKWA